MYREDSCRAHPSVSPTTPASGRRPNAAANDIRTTAAATPVLPPISPFANALRIPRMSGKLSNSTTKSVMTHARLYALIHQGFGQGRNDSYKPWIRVTRRNSSPKSNLHVCQSARQKRAMHLLAGTEFHAGHLAAWLGSLETREQLPLWPHSAPHPLGGLHVERDRTLENTRGMLDIANEAGIDHGNFFGTRIPYVATTDLVLRIGTPPDDRLVFWSVKPLRLILRGPRSARIRERLELERRYALSVGSVHRVICGPEMTSSLCANLDWLMPLYSEFSQSLHPERLQAFAAAFSHPALQRAPLEDCIAHARGVLGLEKENADALFRCATWVGLTDIDLTKPILMTRPPTQGGCAVKASMAHVLLGGAK